jgi:hypothetical protein
MKAHDLAKLLLNCPNNDINILTPLGKHDIYSIEVEAVNTMLHLPEPDYEKEMIEDKETGRKDFSMKYAMKPYGLYNEENSNPKIYIITPLFRDAVQGLKQMNINEHFKLVSE